LQAENERLKRQITAGKDVWRQDQARIEELQSKVDAMGKGEAA
jgi:chaperonin cofactor prefoldin